MHQGEMPRSGAGAKKLSCGVLSMADDDPNRVAADELRETLRGLRAKADALAKENARLTAEMKTRSSLDVRPWLVAILLIMFVAMCESARPVW